ncbi:aminotransferase class I/II-fold pyridoxal phosphate-dependent enzyme [Actinomycetota bacterium]|nr:aminotransferase class I/II-fold pyridoxal phosphate-dependent enzyme [Actinomycetota bacterium]
MGSTRRKRFLSAPTVTESDITRVVHALESGWIAPTGPDLTAFESQMAEYLGVGHAVGLSSGTAALHLGLKYLGVKPGDVVLVPSLTFGATAFAVNYLRAEPIFVDADDSWNMDPEQTRRALESLSREGRRVGAVLPVDLYGSPANFGELLPLFLEFDVPVFEDAAEGLGSSYGKQKLGSLGLGGALSFNGNKILTTSGGGMLITHDGEFASKVLFWAAQSREKLPWYEHDEIGYNYRLSNILAALGRSQLERIDQTVARRREVRELYRTGLADFDGVLVQEDPPWGRSNAWLSVVTFDLGLHPDAPTQIRLALEERNIESRPIWKPMHQQPVFRGARSFLNGKADSVYSSGLCLPSGPGITDLDVEEVCSVISRTLGPRA